MKHFALLSTLAGVIPLIHGHGFVTNPTARMPGSAMQAACGQQVETNQKSDNYGNVQGELQVANSQSDYDAGKCDIWLCKGYKFADNKENVYSYSAGQTVDFTVDIRAPHTGSANVSVVDTTSNSVIGSPLVSWDVYASVESTLPANNTEFSVTIPDDLGDQCSTAGACVLQWYWFAESIDQTYESCVDFTVGGSGDISGSGSSSSSPSAAPSSSAAASPSSPVFLSKTSKTSPVPVTTSAAEQTSTPVETTSAAGIDFASTTFATRALQSSVPAQPDSPSSVLSPSSTAATSVSIPTNGSSQEKLDWISAVFKYLVNGS